MSTVPTALDLVEHVYDAVDEMREQAGAISATISSSGDVAAVAGDAAAAIRAQYVAARGALTQLRGMLDPTTADRAAPGECPTVGWCELGGEHRTHRRSVHTVRIGTEQYIEIGVAAVDGEAPWVQLGHVITVGTVLPAGMVRLSMGQARELGGGLVDVVRRFG